MKQLILIALSLCAFSFFNTMNAQEVKINHDGTDGLVVEADGTIVAEGAATTWRDELQPLVGKKLDDGKGNVAIDLDEFTVNFEADADIDDGVVMNIQLNHDWDGETPVEPHLHWFQNQNEIPNWLIAYRWHQNGQAKVETWTYQKVASSVYTYSSGTILQISSFGSIAPPATPTDVSSILQLKLMRDNGPAKYDNPDDYSGDAHGLSLDIHIKINTMGSRDEYAK